jgi:hypothetical protein
MTDVQKPYEIIKDYATGKEIPEVGAEDNRQLFERFLVEKKGFDKSDIDIDVDIETRAKGETYRSQVGLVVSVGDIRFMAVKCVAGALQSWEKEIISAARLLESYQIPYSVVVDGKSAMIWETFTGKLAGEGMDAVFSKSEAEKLLSSMELQPLPEKRRERESLIFRSYDSMNVNVSRKIPSE